MTNSLIDLMIADLHKGARGVVSFVTSVPTSGSMFNGKTLKKMAKHASTPLRVSLRSAHRFSVTEEMQLFCKDMAFRLRETEFEALIENATPPFECAFFENMPIEGVGVLVERARWNPIDVFFPVAETSAGPELRQYDHSRQFAAWSTSPKKKKQEAVVAEHGVPNSKDHPVYFAQTVAKFPNSSVMPATFGFYFCPSGFLWKPWPEITVASEEFKIQNALLRSALALGDIEIPPDSEDMTYRLPAATRKISAATTDFFPMFVGSKYPVDSTPRSREDLFEGSENIAKKFGWGNTSLNGIENCLLKTLATKEALQILSLLSTLNFDWIVDGTEPGKEGKRVRIEPDAPFNSHSEIQINLPKEKGIELVLKKFHRASPLGVRRHWVRAHNRVIRKNGVPVRVIRVSEHQRGDAKLGTVTHDYVLERDHKVKA